MEGASLGEWCGMSPDGGGQGRWCQPGNSPLPPGMPAALIPPSCDEGSPGVLRDRSLEKQQAQIEPGLGTDPPSPWGCR